MSKFLTKKCGRITHCEFTFLSTEHRTAEIILNYIASRLAQLYNVRYLLFSVIKVVRRCPGVIGISIQCKGRFTRKLRAACVNMSSSGHRVKKSTISSLIDYAGRGIRLRNGVCGIKV